MKRVFALLTLLLTACTAEAPEPPIQRIAFGSCALQWEPQPILDTVVAAEPDLFLYLGDAIYGDWDGEKAYDVTLESLRGEWKKLGDKPEFQRLRAAVPLLATWDNHDYGTHNGGVEFPLKVESKRIFLDFFGEPAGSRRRSRPGIYDARIYGPPGKWLQVILLDTRTFKGPFVKGTTTKYAPNPDPSVTLLGSAQWAWLEAELAKPADLRFICSSTQIIADGKGMDEWGCFPHERTRLLDLVGKVGPEPVLLLSGNVHFTEISATEVDGKRVVDFTSSGMTHVNPKYAAAPNSYRVAGPRVKENVGLVEIDWNAGPSLVLKAIGIDGSVHFEHTMTPADAR